MRTPPVMILGLVLSPAGFVLILVSTVAPAWRDVSNIPTDALDTVLHQGLWEICREKESVRETTCGVADVAYFQHQVLGLSRGLMIAGLVVTALGVLLSSLGVRCWTQHPNLAVSGAGGVVLGSGGADPGRRVLVHGQAPGAAQLRGRTVPQCGLQHRPGLHRRLPGDPGGALPGLQLREAVRTAEGEGQTVRSEEEGSATPREALPAGDLQPRPGGGYPRGVRPLRPLGRGSIGTKRIDRLLAGRR
eukprot:gi/632949351/ref/XP_007890108.1/ PREDICTED: claudin-23-like [Callorhinchus milii]